MNEQQLTDEDLHEFLYADLGGLLEQRALNPSWVYYFVNGAAEGWESFCADCIKGYQPAEWEQGEDYLCGWDALSDGVLFCECCGSPLQYELTEYGIANEYEHYTDPATPFDWSNAQECYEMLRLMHGVFDYGDGDKKQALVNVLVNGIDKPDDIPHLYARRIAAESEASDGN